MVLDCQNQQSWELLALKFLDLDLSGRSSDLRECIQMLGEQLLG